jgi:hypothetical protein
MSLYISDKLSYKVRHDLTQTNNDTEMIWVKLLQIPSGPKNITLVGSIYKRPGSDINLFNKTLADTLDLLSNENKTIYHMGDYNLDLLKADSHPLTNDFIDINFSRSLIPTIRKPTRITDTTATLIDNK